MGLYEGKKKAYSNNFGDGSRRWVVYNRRAAVGLGRSHTQFKESPMKQFNN